MQFNFAAIIDELNTNLPFGDNFSFQIARAAVMPADYVFNNILPQQGRPTYNITGGSMRIFPTMAGQVPMDTPLPPIGAMTSEVFNENTTKIGGQMHFPEKMLRELQEWAQYQRGVGIGRGMTAGAVLASEKERLVQNLLAFSQLLLKSQWDTYEWLRSRAIMAGAINWTYNKLNLTVDYGTPAANILAYTGTDSFYNTASKFWTAYRYAFTRLNAGFQLVMNYNTYLSIVDNSVNNIVVTAEDGDRREIIKWDTSKSSPTTVDRRDRASIILYNKSGTVIDAAGNLIALPFVADGEFAFIGEEKPQGFELLTGSVDDPARDYQLGYTHIAPTVEGGEAAIWSRIYTPEQKPYQVLGETASNGLPVIISPGRIVRGTTAMPS